MTESDTAGLRDLQQTIQQVLASLQHVQGTPPSQVEGPLKAALADAGLPDQPESWVRDTAAELSAGRIVVVAPKEIPEEVEHLEPDPDQHAAG